MRDATGGVSPDVNWLIHDIKLLLGMDLFKNPQSNNFTENSVGKSIKP